MRHTHKIETAAAATARAEIQFDSAHFLRLGSDTEVRLAEVDGNHFQVELSRGTVTLSVIRDPQAQIEVNTPNVSVSPSGRAMAGLLARGSSSVSSPSRSPSGVNRKRTRRLQLRAQPRLRA